MGELTGKIVGLTSYDYVSDVTGEPGQGCYATIANDAGNTAIYTTSERLQSTLEMAYATKCRVTVEFLGEQTDSSKAATGLHAELSAMEAENQALQIRTVSTRE